MSDRKNKILFPPEIIHNTVEAYFLNNSKRATIVYWIILINIAVLIASLPLVKVSITTQSRGIMRANQENNQLYTLINGTIAQINISENQYVEKGDTLLILETTYLDQKIEAHEQKTKHNQACIYDLNQCLAERPKSIKTLRFRSEFIEFSTQLENQQQETQMFKQLKEVSDHLYKNKIEPELEHNNHVNKYEASLRKEDMIRTQYLRKWNVELEKLKQEQINLKSGITGLKEDRKKYIVAAPIDGTLVETSGFKPGNFIASNQTIAQISPNTDLVAECYILPDNIGLIHTGMPVRFQIDAFNYNRWGTVEGYVYSISDDVFMMEQGPVFRVKSYLSSDTLSLQSGFSSTVKKGMTVTGHFYLTERTMAQLLYDKVDNWLNPKIVKK